MADTDDADDAPLPPVEFAPLTAPPAATHRVWTVFVGFAGAVATSALGASLAVGSMALVASLRQRLAQGAWMSPPMTLAFAHALVGQPVGALAASLATGLSLAAFALLPASLSSELLVDRLRLRARPRWLAWGVLAAWGLRGLADLVAGTAQLLAREPRGPYGALAGALSPARPGLVLLALFVHGGVVAAGEELFFRGYVLGRLERRWGARVAVVTSAVLFAALHASDPAQGAFALAAGFFLGWVSARAGTLRVTLVAHGLHNAAAVLALTATPALRSRTLTGVWMAVGAVAVVVCVALFRRLDPDDVT